MTCPCGRPTLSPPLCFYCAAGTSEAAQAEIKAAKRLAAAGDFYDPLMDRFLTPEVFTLISDEAGHLFCLPGEYRPAGRGVVVALFELSAGGKWIRRVAASATARKGGPG